MVPRLSAFINLEFRGEQLDGRIDRAARPESLDYVLLYSSKLTRLAIQVNLDRQRVRYIPAIFISILITAARTS